MEKERCQHSNLISVSLLPLSKNTPQKKNESKNIPQTTKHLYKP